MYLVRKISWKRKKKRELTSNETAKKKGKSEKKKYISGTSLISINNQTLEKKKKINYACAIYWIYFGYV